MQDKQCPLCFGLLVVRELAPCDCCGGVPEELEHFRSGTHSYAEYEVGFLPGHRLVLCNICDIEFGQYDPAYFGLPRSYPMERVFPREMQMIRKLDIRATGPGKICPDCGYALRFLKFIAASRERNDAGEQN